MREVRLQKQPSCYNDTERLLHESEYKPVRLYIRFWEYSNGVGGFPDWCIILVYCNFAKKQDQELQKLVWFFKEYAPWYGYKYIGMEDNPRLNQVLGFQRIQSISGQENFIAELIVGL